MQSAIPQQRKSAVLRGTAILSLGGIAAGAISALATPVYAHLYTPGQLGDGAIALALTTCLLPLTTWRLEYAIVNEKSDCNVNILLQLCLITTTTCALLLWMIVLGAGDKLGLLAPRAVLTLLPMLVFSLSFINTASYFFTRQQRFRTMSLNQILQAIVRSGLIIGLAYAGWEQGVTYGYLFAAVLIALVCAIQMQSSGVWHRMLNIQTAALRNALLTHHDLIKHNLSTSFLNSIASNLMPIVFSAYFTSRAAGYLFVLQQLIAMPAQVIAQAFWRTMFARLGLCNDNHERSRIVISAYDLTVPLLLMPVVVVMCLQDDVQSRLNEEWQTIAGLLVPFMAMVFFNTLSNITSYFVSFGKYRAESAWNVAILAVRIGAVFVLPLFFDSMVTCIVFYLLASSAIYFALNIYWAITLKFVSQFCLSNMFLVTPIFVIGLIASRHSAGLPKYLIFSAVLLALGFTAYYRYRRTFETH